MTEIFSKKFWVAPALVVVSLILGAMAWGNTGGNANSPAQGSQVALSILEPVDQSSEENVDPYIESTLREVFALQRQIESIRSDNPASSPTAMPEVSSLGVTQTKMGSEATVLRASDQVCIFDSADGGTCGNDSLIRDTGLFVANSDSSCETETVLGLVPDGIDDLAVIRDGQKRGSVEVVYNVFKSRLLAQKTALVHEESGFRIDLPLSMYNSQDSICS